jgi:insulin-like growth factor 2 mRNA-binding protein 1
MVGGAAGGEFQQRPNPSDMPLRMVVDARFVGAIIGQGGANIREITRESKARCVVDVTRGIRDQSGAMEKIINIYGMPENCSKACIKILEVVQRETAKESTEQQPDPELKLRAHNQLVGRLIGKGGVTIKKIMEDTSCTIFVSNELNAFNMERTITIRGQMDQIKVAEERISHKLRQCWENDMMNGPMSFAGPHGHPLMGPHTGLPPGPEGVMGAGVPFTTPVGPVMGPGGPMVPNGSGVPMGHPGGARGGPQPPMTEVVHMWVPNNIVGALIGTKGVHIRNVMRLTGAHIRIEGGSGRSEDGRGDARQLDERQVTITGTDQQQYKAQFWIYQRVCEQGYHFFDEVRLCTEVSVPTKLVGRIIGKGGQNVRELQRMTGAQVKIPEDAANDEAAETIVRVTGNFNASQAVQARIRQLVQQFHLQGIQGGM